MNRRSPGRGTRGMPTTASIGLLNKARLVSSCPFGAPLLAIVSDKNQLLMVSPGKKDQMLWCVQLKQPATMLSWSPDLKSIAIGPELRLLSVETGQEIGGPEGTNVRWLKWICCGDICLLALQETKSRKIRLVIEGYHTIDVLLDDMAVQDMHVSDDMSRLFVLNDKGLVSCFTTGWNKSNTQSLRAILKLHRSSVMKEESWKYFVESIKKYGTGIKWAVDKLRATEPSGQIEPAVLALALLTDAPDNEHLNRLKKSTTTRDAYKYRDQLVRCCEDMRKKFDAIGLVVKESEPFTSSLDSIEKQLKDFIAWFLSLFSSNSDSGKVSLSAIVDALNCKDLNNLRSLSESCLKKETARIQASAASMGHLKQIRCTLTMQEQMQFEPSSGLLGTLRSGTVVLVGLDTTRTQVLMWSYEILGDTRHEMLSRSNAIKTLILTYNQTLKLVFFDGSVELLDLCSPITQVAIHANQASNSTSNHIKVLCEEHGSITVL